MLSSSVTTNVIIPRIAGQFQYMLVRCGAFSIRDLFALVSSSIELRLYIVVKNVTTVIQILRQVQEDGGVAQTGLFLVLYLILHMQ